jgi:hypothetical protein
MIALPPRRPGIDAGDHWNGLERHPVNVWHVCMLSVVVAARVAAGATATRPAALAVTAPPKAVVEALKLSPFYKKYVSAAGLAVIASEKVNDYALLEAAYLIRQMIAHRPDVLKAMIDAKVRVVVMAATEFSTDVPEHSDLKPAAFWDKRARGLGATPRRPATSCGEENLLRYRGDPYRAENILIHEFAHTIHHMGLNRIDKTFDKRLERAYRQAIAKGLWKGKYAGRNRAEYWAEAVQSWFDTNRPPDHDHNHVDTREELKAYDPGIAKLVQETFGDREWRYRRPFDRKYPAHLAGYDRPEAPRFAWPDRVLKAWQAHQASRKPTRPKSPAKQAAAPKAATKP